MSLKRTGLKTIVEETARNEKDAAFIFYIPSINKVIVTFVTQLAMTLVALICVHYFRQLVSKK